MKLAERQLVIATVIGLVLIVGMTAARRPPEPVYQGRPLSAWLEDLMKGRDGVEHDQAEDAVRAIGNRALPSLCRLLACEESRAERIARGLLSGLPGVHYRGTPVAENHEKALRGFIALGPAAKPAIPELRELLERTGWKEVGELLLALSPDGERSLSQFRPPARWR